MSTTTVDPAATPQETPKPQPPTPALTQPTEPVEQEAPLGEGGVKALQRERDARAAADKALADLRKEIEDGKKTAEQKAADDLAAEKRTSQENAAKALRYEVAAEKGLDLKFASRLTGSTKEELEADADALMALIPTPDSTPPVPSGPVVPGEGTGSGSGGAQVTQADLNALEAAGKYGEINELRKAGRLDHLLKK